MPYRDPAPREDERSMKKPWWKFWQCRKRNAEPITASLAAKRAEETKRKLHEEDIGKCRAWFEEKIELGVSKGWTGLIGKYDLSVSGEAYEVVSKEYKERGFFVELSPKKRGYHISWIATVDHNDAKTRLEEWDQKLFLAAPPYLFLAAPALALLSY